MIALLILLAGMQLSGPIANRTEYNLIGLGDSNTEENPAWTNKWMSWCEQYLLTENITYFNAGIGGDTPQGMMARFTTDVAPNYAPGAICVILAGLNSDNGTNTADSIYKWIAMLCDTAQKNGFVTLVSTYPMQQHIMFDVNDLIIAGWSAHADGLIDPTLDPNIGEASDHYNTTYFGNIYHFNTEGQRIYATAYVIPEIRKWI